jgi:hypothetical protein
MIRRSTMPYTRKCVAISLILISVMLASSFLYAQQSGDFAPMPGPGKKVPLAGDHYLIYGFDKAPKLGTVIMKVEIFTKDGKKDTSFEVKADAGMPSMKGAHETGERPFQLSKKGDYLLPVNIVMPGDWEIRVTVAKGGKPIFKGRYNFDV